MNRLWRVVWCVLFASSALPGQLSAAKLDEAEYRAKVAALGGSPGYLAPMALPDSMALLPAPPVAGSAGEARDWAAAKEAHSLADSFRWQVATNDAELRGEASIKSFACAAGIDINPLRTPRTWQLLRRSLVDFGLATYAAKTSYRRARPFTVNGAPTCTPKDEPALRADGSYPSGHSAIGFGWGLVLAELVPTHADALVRRGIDFGDSRTVCNVHWASDVEQGRVVASAVFARLQGEAEFRNDAEGARAELAAAAKAAAGEVAGCLMPR